MANSGRESASEWHERLRIAMVKAVSEEDVRDVMQAMVLHAKKGDLKAAQMLLQFLAPPPPPRETPVVQIDARGSRPRLHAAPPARGRVLEG